MGKHILIVPPSGLRNGLNFLNWIQYNFSLKLRDFVKVISPLFIGPLYYANNWTNEQLQLKFQFDACPYGVAVECLWNAQCPSTFPVFIYYLWFSLTFLMNTICWVRTSDINQQNSNFHSLGRKIIVEGNI